MKTFFHHIQALWKMPHRFRSSYVPSDSDLARRIVEQTQGPVRYACFMYASRSSSDEDAG